MGFMSTVGEILAASACAAWARPISPPSAAQALSDMFWALNGATRWPARANRRQSAVVSMLLPTPEAVPWIIRHGAGARTRGVTGGRRRRAGEPGAVAGRDAAGTEGPAGSSRPRERPRRAPRETTTP